jgi:uncharacterized protein (DUF433 family)
MKPLVRIDPEIMSGAPCFAGTRVPFRTMFDHLVAGESLDVFLDDFPSVAREQAVAALEAGYERVLAEAEVVEPARR